MQTPNDATDHLTLLSDGNIASSAVESLHDTRTDSNYQVSTTGKLNLVVQVTGGGSGTEFKVWKSDTAESTAGTTVYHFSNSSDLGTSDIFTTPVLEFDVAANDYINVESTGSTNIPGVKAWVVEKPSS